MKRDEFVKMLAEVINGSYNLPFKFVKRKCDRHNENELPKNITTSSYLLTYKRL